MLTEHLHRELADKGVAPGTGSPEKVSLIFPVPLNQGLKLTYIQVLQSGDNLFTNTRGSCCSTYLQQVHLTNLITSLLPVTLHEEKLSHRR